MNVFVLVIIVLCLLAAIIPHEYAHGWMAYKLGDNTAKEQGRLTWNPIAHLDLVGSFLLPLICVMMGGFIIAYAKPVPVNFHKLRDKHGMLKVSLAGPAANLLLALFFGLVLRFIPLGDLFGTILAFFVLINLILMIFNLIPIPPLDGSKVLVSFLPHEWKMKFLQFEAYGFFLIIFFIILGGFKFIFMLASLLFTLITGMSFML